MIKVDMHLHSTASNRPAGFLSKKLGICESYSQPIKLYEKLMENGMTLFTLTDHDSINGCLEVAHLPNVFISEEITAYFPEDRCKIHVLAYDINEKIHSEIQKLRENVYDLVDYLNQENVIFALAHPFYDMVGKLSKEHVEKFLLLFDTWEIYNGTRSRLSAVLTAKVALKFKWDDILKLADKHGFLKRKRKRISFIGGSDDHSGLDAGKTFTFVKAGETVEDLKLAIAECRTLPSGIHGSPKRLTHTVMNIAFQGANQKYNLGEFKHIFCNLFDVENGSKKFSISKFIKNGKSEQFIRKIMGESYEDVKDNIHSRIYTFVNSLLPYALGRITKEENITFSTLTSSLGLSVLSMLPMATYAATYWQRALEKNKSKELYSALTGEQHIEGKMACFTDTFFEINGVARTYQKIIDVAKEEKLNLKVIVTDTRGESDEYLKVFRPIASFPLPEYEEIPINIPNFLEILEYVERENFDVIYAATPGILGIVAFLVAKILNLPFVTTFHTDIPEYVYKYTEDHIAKDITWKLLSAFYNSSTKVLSPSKCYKDVLVENGVKEELIEVFQRGVDLQKFNPKYRNPDFFKRFDPSYNGEKVVLYVGRVSKEKEIDVFIEVANRLKDRKDMKFIIVGDGPYRKEAEQKAENVIFTGYLEKEELSTAYASADIFLFPSTTETFGNVILEAYASGLPVLVSDRGASKENVIHGVTGFVVKNNRVERYIDIITTLLDDEKFYNNLKANALSYIKDKEYKKLLLEVIKTMSLGKIKRKEEEIEFLEGAIYETV